MAYHSEVYLDEALSHRFGTIYLCVNCSTELGKTKKLYCEMCGTKAGREQMKKENEEKGIFV